MQPTNCSRQPNISKLERAELRKYVCACSNESDVGALQVDVAEAVRVIAVTSCGHLRHCSGSITLQSFS